MTQTMKPKPMVTVYAVHVPGEGYRIEARGEQGRKVPAVARPREISSSVRTSAEAVMMCEAWVEVLKTRRNTLATSLGVVDPIRFDREW